MNLNDAQDILFEELIARWNNPDDYSAEITEAMRVVLTETYRTRLGEMMAERERR